MTVSREQVATAIFKSLTTIASVQWVTKSRILKMWTDVQPDQRPALFLVEHHESYARQNEKLRKRTLEFNIFIYLNTKPTDQYVSGGAQLNFILDQIDAALAPSGIDVLNSRDTNTLGGLVQHCYIDGQIIKVPGDLEGDGLLVIPVKVLMP